MVSHFTQDKIKTSSTCPTRPYMIWPPAQPHLPFTHHNLATSHSFSSWNGQNIFPLQDVPTCHFPAWKIIPASFYTNADSLFRSQLKSYFCKKVFPGHSLHNLKFGRLLIISHNWCYLASYPIPICDYPCCVTVFHF